MNRQLWTIAHGESCNLIKVRVDFQAVTLAASTRKVGRVVNQDVRKVTCDATSEYEREICIVTGANSGIGKETALGLAQMDPRVVMVCRNQKKGERPWRRSAANPVLGSLIC